MNQSNGRYILSEREVKIEDSVIMFDYPIIEFVEVSDMLIVRLEKPLNIIYNENVFGISLREKKVKWRIAKRDYILNDCPFIKIRMFEGQLVLINWCSFYLYANPLNGEILEEGFTK